MDRGEIKIMLRILHILDSLDMGGIEVFVMNLYKNIDHLKIILSKKRYNMEVKFLKEQAKIILNK